MKFHCPASIKYPIVLHFLLLCVAIPISAQKIDLNSSWTNGFDSFYPEKLSNGIINFQGGSLHEGGYGFKLKMEKDGKLSIYMDTSESSVFEKGDNIELKTIKNLQVLIFRHKNGEIFDFFRQSYPGESLRYLILKTKINHELAGKYINSRNGAVITFESEIRIVKGWGNLIEYDFEDEYDSPSDAITFNKKQTFIYEITEKGMDLYTATNEQYDEWTRVRKIMSLVKTEWLNADSLKNIPGKYPFGSHEFLIDRILCCYSSTKLSIMRNEIYARHGLIFKSASLKNYFSKQNWYKPVKENVDTELSDLEKLNILLIQRYEQKQREDEAMRKRDSS